MNKLTLLLLPAVACVSLALLAPPALTRAASPQPRLADDAAPAANDDTLATSQHEDQADALVESLKGATMNVYGKGKRNIVWDTEPASARTVCSSFTTLLLEHTYGWTDKDMKAWFGKADPDAADYYEVVKHEKKFERVRNVNHIRRGDIITIKYYDDSDDTGHVMTVDQPPMPYTATAPIVPGTSQYEVTVIDSSKSGHGPTDTRWLHDRVYSGGIGRGVLRLYANDKGDVVGYAWSDYDKSPYYTYPARVIAIGRLKAATQ